MQQGRSVLTLIIACLGLCFLNACKGGEAENGAGGAVQYAGLAGKFSALNLPVTMSDSIFLIKPKEAEKLDINAFKGLPGLDSLLALVHGKAKPALYPVGKFQNETEENYIVFRTHQGKTDGLFCYALPTAEHSPAGILLLSNSEKATPIDQVEITKSFLFNLSDNYLENTDTKTFTTVNAYNNAGLFMVILSDGLEKGKDALIINPIDTLPATQKGAGNYKIDERNLLTIRNGTKPNTFMFYIFMDKKDGCIGEIKGEATWATEDSASFQNTSDPCAIGFTFKGKQVKVNEEFSCGNFHGSDCNFSALYNKETPKTNKDALAEKK